jgi:hypothetical protein
MPRAVSHFKSTDTFGEVPQLIATWAPSGQLQLKGVTCGLEFSLKVDELSVAVWKAQAVPGHGTGRFEVDSKSANS